MQLKKGRSLPKIGLLNYGAGNFASVRNALCHIGLEPLEVTDPTAMDDATHLILPGVGSFPAAMNRLSEMKIWEELDRQVNRKHKPFLGICVGMQILADRGFEFEETRGLGWIGGEVKQIDSKAHSLSVPHIGWNELIVNQQNELLQNLPDSPSFYFVHSFAFQPAVAETQIAVCEYGQEITAIVQKENIFGVQFHPEKSQRDGLQLLKNFSQA